MTLTINEFKMKIEFGSFPTDYKYFAGSNLIITDDPTYIGDEDTITICSAHAGALSWMVFTLKNFYLHRLNHLSKLEFYEEIGNILKANLKQDGDLIDAMLKVVDEIAVSFPLQEKMES